jgi:hypothetical protein
MLSCSASSDRAPSSISTMLSSPGCSSSGSCSDSQVASSSRTHSPTNESLPKRTYFWPPAKYLKVFVLSTEGKYPEPLLDALLGHPRPSCLRYSDGLDDAAIQQGGVGPKLKRDIFHRGSLLLEHEDAHSCGGGPEGDELLFISRGGKDVLDHQRLTISP